MSPFTVLTCCNCDKVFEKRTAEVTRQRKKTPGYPFYCSRKCFFDHKGKFNLGEALGKGNPALLDPANRKDDFSPFRYFLRKARARSGHSCMDLNLPYLMELWSSQKGTCPITGTAMILPRTSLEWENDKANPWKPSLDRIDPKKGYVQGNVRFITNISNLCKNVWEDSVVVEFCNRVVLQNS